MTLRNLRIFKEVCRVESFTKAAQNLYMSQPAVSHAIQELEMDVGTPLFDRLARKIYTNQAGRMYLQKVTRILELYDDMQATKANLELQAPLRIGSSITIANFWLPTIVKQFEMDYPSTQVFVEVNQAKEVMALLVDNKIDIAYIEGVVPHSQFVVVPISSYGLCIVCAPSHPFVKQENVDLVQLVREPFLLREKGSAIRDVFDSAMFLNHQSIQPTWTSVNSQALIQAVKQGIGLSVLPTLLIQEEVENGSLAIVRVKELSLKNDNQIVYHKDKIISKTLASLIELSMK